MFRKSGKGVRIMDIFEAIMMVCFGASWPVSIWKTVKVKNPIGKSVIFLWLVEIGYISGIIYKLAHPDWVIALYCLNAAMGRHRSLSGDEVQPDAPEGKSAGHEKSRSGFCGAAFSFLRRSPGAEIPIGAGLLNVLPP